MRVTPVLSFVWRCRVTVRAPFLVQKIKRSGSGTLRQRTVPLLKVTEVRKYKQLSDYIFNDNKAKAGQGLSDVKPIRSCGAFVQSRTPDNFEWSVVST